MKQLTGAIGVGISYRPEFRDFEARLAEHVDCVEVILEQTFQEGLDGAEVLRWDMPTLAHAISLSPARADFVLSDEQVAMLGRAADAGVRVVSDHLSYSAVHDLAVPNFFSCVRTTEEADRVARNVRAIAVHTGEAVVALENAVTFISNPGDQLSEVDFVNEVLERADCSMILDLNNLYINARNVGFDPFDYLERLDSDRIAYLHVAGHAEFGEVLVDSHAAPVADPVWELVRAALERSAPIALVLERDNASATEDELVAELALLRAVWDDHQPATRESPAHQPSSNTRR